MEVASERMILKDLAHLIHNVEGRLVVFENDVKEISNFALANYSNVYASTNVNKQGIKVITINSKHTHKNFFEAAII